jgi:hypothetical protein
MAKKLNLTRDQIAGFVGDDPRAVKQLEKLITEVQSLVTNQATESANTIASLRSEIEDLKAQIQAARKRDVYTFDETPQRRVVVRNAAVDSSETAGHAFSRPRYVAPPKRYGMFYRETTIAPTGAAQPIPWEIPLPNFWAETIRVGVYRGTNPVELYVTDAGIYNVEISAQFKCTELGGSDLVDLFLNTPTAATGFQFNQRRITFTGGSSYDEYQFISFSVKGAIWPGVPLIAYFRSAAAITELYGETPSIGTELIPAAMISITKDS